MSDESSSSSSSSSIQVTNAFNNNNNTKSKNDNKEEITILDTLAVERERGITVRASAASMLYRHPSSSTSSEWMLLNMVDTPGHVGKFGHHVYVGVEYFTTTVAEQPCILCFLVLGIYTKLTAASLHSSHLIIVCCM
jgi:hypothetical protein